MDLAIGVDKNSLRAASPTDDGADKVRIRYHS